MKIGDYIRVAGKKPDWLDRQRGLTFSDYDALVVEMKLDDNIFHCMIMKSDGSLWNVYEKSILEHHGV